MSEEMTRVRAIGVITLHREHWQRLMQGNVCSKQEGEESIAAFDVALAALSAEPCGDAISRQEAIDELEYHTLFWNTDDMRMAVDVIKDLPSVQPIRPSVIEDIKSEIKQKREENRNGEYDKIFELCLLIIDKHTSGKDQA